MNQQSPTYLGKYKLTSIEVIGLMIGARGTITQTLVKFCKRFRLQSSLISDIAIAAIKGSLQILRNHIYST